MSAPARILLVDDESDLATCLSMVLTEEGYEVFTAPDGAEALAACAERPALVLVDYYLPGQPTGAALVAALRRRCAPGTPIILMSAQRESAETRSAGADGYLEKPFDMDKLLGILRRHLGDEAPQPDLR